MALEKEFWQLVREDGSTNEFDWCITKINESDNFPGHLLKSLKKTTFQSEESRKTWYRKAKKGLLETSSYFSNENCHANSVLLIKSIRDNIIHANSDEALKIQTFITKEKDGDTIFYSAFASATNLLSEICLLNYQVNQSSANHSATIFVSEFVRKFNFWLKGVTVFG